MSINSKKRRDGKKAKAKVKRSGLPPKPPALYQLDRLRKDYIKSWGINSDGHLAQGHYEWMAARVDGFQRTLEIGCGVGHSTLALLAQGHTVVCIEENPHCIAATQKRVASHGYSVAVVSREKPESLGDNAYRLRYSDVENAPQVACLLIEGDALSDPKLKAWLERQPKFDSIACWLLGTHDARGHNIAIDLAMMPTSREHRIYVQNNVYEVADRILRPGGILTVIDRTETPSTQALIEKIMEHHREQASVTSLVVQRVDHVPYVASEEKGAMPMLVTFAEDTQQSLVSETAPTMSLCSTTSVKP